MKVQWSSICHPELSLKSSRGARVLHSYSTVLASSFPSSVAAQLDPTKLVWIWLVCWARFGIRSRLGIACVGNVRWVDSSLSDPLPGCEICFSFLFWENFEFSVLCRRTRAGFLPCSPQFSDSHRLHACLIHSFPLLFRRKLIGIAGCSNSTRFNLNRLLQVQQLY